MRILHYSLGFPPYRTGGLTKFCIDIMQEEKRIGHDVSLLWPGEIKLLNKRVNIKKRKSWQGIGSWELINPLPVSYDEGIVDIEAFTASCNKDIFIDFLKRIQPEIIHLHTLMGVYKEFLEAARELSIKTVFSVHDFYPICPKVTIFRGDSVCEQVSTCSECPQCNLTALSLRKIFILQSPVYRLFKDSFISRKLRKNHRDKYLSGKFDEKYKKTSKAVREMHDYKRLRHFYSEIISCIDIVHYNSSITKQIFESFFQVKDSVLISISHADIKDNREVKKFGDKLRLTYLGPQGSAKGFFLIKKALDHLWIKNDKEKVEYNFSLNIFFSPIEKSPYMRVKGRYKYSDLGDIFDNTDVLIAPSIWNETFGYTVLEALSFGVPVIVSKNVGAKDIIPEGGGIVLEDLNYETLENEIIKLNPEKLRTMNYNICKYAKIKTLNEMTMEIINECY